MKEINKEFLALPLVVNVVLRLPVAQNPVRLPHKSFGSFLRWKGRVHFFIMKKHLGEMVSGYMRLDITLQQTTNSILLNTVWQSRLVTSY